MSIYGEGSSMGGRESESTAVGSTLRVVQTRGRIEDSYNLMDNSVGHGGFGAVFPAASKTSQVVRAVKYVPHINDTHIWKKFNEGRQHEAQIMAELDHPNIVRLYEIFEDRSRMCLVMEMCQGGDLGRRLKKCGPFSSDDVFVVMRQVFHAVSYMHSRQIIHRDLKLENFLLANDGPLSNNLVKVADFGLSTMVEPGQVLSLKTGTPRYMSPELLKGRYTFPSDVWSCGVCIYVALSGQMPFDGRTDDDVFHKVKRGNYSLSGPIWNDVPDDAKDLVRAALKYDPEERESARMIVQSLRFPVAQFVAELPPSTPNGQGGTLAQGVWNLVGLPKLRRAAFRALAWQMDDLMIRERASMFFSLDKDGDGMLSAEETCQALMAAGAPEPTLQAACDIAPLDYTDFVVMSLGEVLCLCTKLYTAAFRALDRDGDGIISAKDLAVQGPVDYKFEGMRYEEFAETVRLLHL